MNIKELTAGCTAFWKHEGRDAIYRVAARLVGESWGDAAEVADALTVLLLVWNQAFYRYGDLEADAVERFLVANGALLERLRWQNLAEYSVRATETEHLFDEFMKASGARGKKDGILRHSPVSTAKGLHLLAPRLFPLWDDAIARAYRCGWDGSANASASYIRFMTETKRLLIELSEESSLEKIESRLCARAAFPKTLLKFLDEYNYARYTKGWWAPGEGTSGS